MNVTVETLKELKKEPKITRNSRLLCHTHCGAGPSTAPGLPLPPLPRALWGPRPQPGGSRLVSLRAPPPPEEVCPEPVCQRRVWAGSSGRRTRARCGPCAWPGTAPGAPRPERAPLRGKSAPVSPSTAGLPWPHPACPFTGWNSQPSHSEVCGF